VTDAIVLEGVTKTFGEKVAVRDLDLKVPQGGLYGFIGPNGAGKTTSIRMIMSILFADSGRVSVLGHASALDAKDRIGYLPEERGLYRKMKVASYLAYIARLKGCSGSDIKTRVQRWLERVELSEVARKKCEELSKGMQQKIQFVAAVIHEPDLIILDEPFSGLDPVNMRLLRDLVRDEHERGATVIFSTHVMTQAEQICDHIVMIDDGNKVLDDTLTGIRKKFDPRTLLFEPLQDDASPAVLEALPVISAVQPAPGGWELTLHDSTPPHEAMQQIIATLPAARIELNRPTLEDVFVQIVTGDGAGSAEASQIRAALRDESAAEVVS